MTNATVNTSSMQPAPGAAAPDNGAQSPPQSPPVSGTVPGSAGPDSAAAQQARTSRKRRSRSKPSSDSAAAKSRKKAAQAVQDGDYAFVGQLVHEAVERGIEPDALVESYRAMVEAWDRVHSK